MERPDLNPPRKIAIMVLASQMTRPEMDRHGMASSKWNRYKWRGLIVLLVILAGGGAGYWKYGGHAGAGSEPTSEPAAAAPPPAATPASVTRFDIAIPGSPQAAKPASASMPPSLATPNSAAAALASSRLAPAAPLVHTPGTPLARSMQLVEDGKALEARQMLNDLLNAPGTPTADAQFIRETMAKLNEKLVFSREVTPGDSLTETYVIQRGDLLARVAPKYKIPYQALELINGVEGRRIQAGQKIKVIKGPFHAVVSKSAFRLDLFLAGPEGKRVYVRSFTVGLGESDSTPAGSFIIKPGGKVAGGGWTNPRTNESFRPGDPKNPIGKYWMALQGTEEKNQNLRGYGIHGTIDPSSIGHQMSMGCIRLIDADIEMLYKLLSDGQSTVTIQP